MDNAFLAKLHRHALGHCRACLLPVDPPPWSPRLRHVYVLHPAQSTPSLADVVLVCKGCLTRITARDLGLSGNALSALNLHGVNRLGHHYESHSFPGEIHHHYECAAADGRPRQGTAHCRVEILTLAGPRERPQGRPRGPRT